MRRLTKTISVLSCMALVAGTVAAPVATSENVIGDKSQSAEASVNVAKKADAACAVSQKAETKETALKDYTISKAELESLANLAETDGKKAAEKINELSGNDYEAAVNNVLKEYYTDNNAEELKVFTSNVDDRAEDIVANYKEAADERDNDAKLDYQPGTSILTFAADMTEEQIKDVVADQYGDVEYIHECPDGSWMVNVSTIGLTAQKAAEAYDEYSQTNTAELNGKVEQTTEAWDLINDSYRYNEYYLSHLNVGEAWNYINSRSHSKVKVTVIDGDGIDINNNTDLKNVSNRNQSICYNEDGSYYAMTSNSTSYSTSNMHMINVAGLVAAQSNNGTMVAGVAAGTDNSIVDLVNVSIPLYVDKMALAIDYANSIGSKVINMSLFHVGSYSYEETAVNNFTASGGTIVAGAGNNGDDLDGYPSDYGNVISIIATNEDKSRRSTSNYGWECDFCAPGTNITVAGYGDTVWVTNGTSMASPIAAGVVAMMYSVNGNLTKSQVHSILQNTATDLGDSGRDYYYAYGLINAGAAVQQAGGGGSTVVTTTTTQSTSGPQEVFGQVISCSADNTINVVWGSNTTMEAAGQRYNVYLDGNKVYDSVTVGSYNITNVSAGNHTIRITAIYNGSETSGVSSDVTVTGGSSSTETTTNSNGYTTAGANWTDMSYWSVYFASGWGNDPTGSYRNGNSYSDFGVSITKAAGDDWAIQMKTQELAQTSGNSYTCRIGLTSNMATGNVIRFKEDKSGTEQMYTLASGSNTLTLTYTSTGTAQIFFDLGQAPVGLNMEITSFELINNDEATTTTTTTTTTSRYYPTSLDAYSTIEAEYFATNEGGVIDTNSDASNGKNIGGITNGVTLRYDNVNFSENAGGLTIDYSSIEGSGGNALVYVDSTDNLVGTIALPSFGTSWYDYKETSGQLDSEISAGSHTIYIKFQTSDSAYFVANVDYYKFITAKTYYKTIDGGIEINGYQISSTAPGFRVDYSVDSQINDKSVSESGLIYTVTVNGQTYTHSYASTAAGKLSSVLSDSDYASSYAMTMKFLANGNNDEYTASYTAKAYAKLADGTYVYTSPVEYTIYNVADEMYQNRTDLTATLRTFLYDTILSKVNTTYAKKD